MNPPHPPCLLVFSHLRWNFVYQRPQHLLSRLARHYPVLFVEEPVHAAAAEARLEVLEGVCPNVTVLRLHSPLPAQGFDDAQLACLAPLLLRHLHDHGVASYLAWFYTPMALSLLQRLHPLAVIYDCMDELASFKGAPPAMRAHEAQLLETADLVLTGGPSLYEAKRHANARVHCLPSSVDAAHYAAGALHRESPAWRAATALQAALPRPRLGFFGVIDERLDLDLVATLAQAHPDWQVVMVGPLCKREASDLPRHPNIAWLGQQDYERLPALVHGWDVCLLPFALNVHTRFISPTKTLEYLAAGKPVVSTPVHDVVALYGEVVRIARTPAGFVHACEAELERPAAERALWRTDAAWVVARSSWDAAAALVLELLAPLARRGGWTPAAPAMRLQAAGSAGTVDCSDTA